MSELKKKYKQLSSISDEWFPRIKKIFLSYRYNRYDVIFDTIDEKVYGFGDNVYGIFGLEPIAKSSEPTVIEELCGTDIKKVVFGERFMVALTHSNELFTGGWCGSGRCGNGTNRGTYCKPKKISTENQLIADFCCGFHYTLILTERQQVYAFGSLQKHGFGCDVNPTQIRLPERITSISCGNFHTLALSQTGRVYAWGYNNYGELGLTRNLEYEDKPQWVQMPNNVSVKQISCGSYHSLLLTTDGDIYSFGNNNCGQLGLKHINSVRTPSLVSSSRKYTEIFAFDSQSFAKNRSNEFEFWGQTIAGETILSPHKTYLNSIHDAIILSSKYPFTIEPIILQRRSIEKPIETTKQTNKYIHHHQPTSNRVMRTMAKSFNNPNNTDFQFKIKREECDDPEKACPSDEPKNKYDIIYCHKWFVEQNCEHLRKMFVNRKLVNETEIKGYTYETYYHFIQYLYTDSIETKDIKLLNELLLLSDMYSEEELKTRCVSLIKPLLNVENVSNFYCSAIINKTSDLEDYCFEFMTKNIKTIVKTKDYSQMDPKIAKSFLAKYVEKQK